MKYSIKRQMLALFTGAVALVIVMMFIINSSFMERFFIQNKKIEMVELYETLDKTAKKGDINSVEIQEELQRQCERKNCAVLVINSGSDITFNTEQERASVYAFDRIYRRKRYWTGSGRKGFLQNIQGPGSGTRRRIYGYGRTVG